MEDAPATESPGEMHNNHQYIIPSLMGSVLDLFNLGSHMRGRHMRGKEFVFFLFALFRGPDFLEASIYIYI